MQHLALPIGGVAVLLLMLSHMQHLQLDGSTNRLQ